MKVEFFNRETGKTETEAIYGEGALRWVYETLLGRVALAVLIRRAFFSKIYGVLMSRPRSRAKIAPFIAQYGIDPAEFAEPVESFGSFNDFFSRKLKASARPIADSAAVLPADGRHLAFPCATPRDKRLIWKNCSAIPRSRGAITVARFCVRAFARRITTASTFRSRERRLRRGS